MDDRSRSNSAPQPAVEELDEEIGPKDLQRFVTVLRGYDRIEVDECLGRIAAMVGTLRAELATGRRALAGLEAQVATATSQRWSPDRPDGNFGVRAERLLRLAETEAREMRGGAAREASALVERARADAEQMRHDMEQALIERSTQQDREHAERMSRLQQREELITQHEGEMGRRDDEARAAARRDVDAMREQALAELAQAREQSDAEITRRTATAHDEVEQLQQTSATMQDELRRLVDVLVHQLEGKKPE